MKMKLEALSEPVIDNNLSKSKYCFYPMNPSKSKHGAYNQVIMCLDLVLPCSICILQYKPRHFFSQKKSIIRTTIKVLLTLIKFTIVNLIKVKRTSI